MTTRRAPRPRYDLSRRLADFPFLLALAERISDFFR